MRKQRHARRNAEAAQLVGCQQGDFRHLLGGWRPVDLRIADEDLPVGQHQHVHRGERLHIRPAADDLADEAEMFAIGADRAAKHGVDIAAPQQHRADERRTGPHRLLGDGEGHALALGQLVIFGDHIPIAAIAEDVHRLAIFAQPQPQAEISDALRDDVGPPDQQREGQPFIHRHLRGAQHALLLAFRIGDALGRGLGGVEHRLHAGAGMIDELRHLLPVGAHIGDGARGDAAIHRRLRDGGRDLLDQTRDRRALGSGNPGRSGPGELHRPSRRDRTPPHGQGRRWRGRRPVSFPR